MWKVPEDSLTIITGHEQLTLYQWNLRIAKHYFCSVCGIYTFHRKRMAPDHFGVNVKCLENFPATEIPVRNTGGKDLSVTS